MFFAYTPGCVPDENIKAWSMASTQFLIDVSGIDNVVSVTLHRDERNPHIHAVVIPIDNKGKQNLMILMSYLKVLNTRIFMKM